MEERNYTVYIHISPNNKYYVGITANTVIRRWNNGRGYIKNKYFYRAIKKYGWKNFQHEIVAEHLTKDEACKFEIALIKALDSTNPNYGYNFSSGGEHGGTGHVVSEETRKKIGDAFRGKPLSEECKRKLSESLKGHAVSDETRELISLHRSGIYHTEETKRKISASKKGQGAIPINQYDLDGNFIRNWESAFVAMKELGFKSSSSIANVLSGKCKSTHGFIFKYAK